MQGEYILSDYPNIKIIGLTGMSGAGKSVVSELFRERGFSVINCDDIARNAAKKPEFLAEIGSRFSQRLIRQDGSLDRPEVAKLIYNDEPSRDKYQSIIFPYIIYDIIERIKGSEGDVILDAPTLFESKTDMICTGIVSVCADVRVCAKRIAERDNISFESALERLSAQHNAEFFKENADHFIVNDGTLDELRNKIDVIINKLR